MLTVSNAIEEIETRITGYIEKANAITGEGKAVSLPSCMAWACRQLGVDIAQLRFVTDDELSAITQVDAFLDLTELRVLESVQTNLSDVTTKVGPVSEDWNDLSKRIADLIAKKRLAIAYQYGIFLDATVAAGQPRTAYMRSI